MSALNTQQIIVTAGSTSPANEGFVQISPDNKIVRGRVSPHINFQDSSPIHHPAKKKRTIMFETPSKLSNVSTAANSSSKNRNSQSPMRLDKSYNKSTDITESPIGKKLNFDLSDESRSQSNIQVDCTFNIFNKLENSTSRCHSPFPKQQNNIISEGGDIGSPSSLSTRGQGRQVQCRYCSESGDIKNLIRPCLCRGSVQYVHQECIQRDVEQNYMDVFKTSFTKSLKCQICLHPFTIKTYISYKLQQALQPNQKFRFLSHILLALLTISILIVIVTSCSSDDQLKYKPQIIFLMALGLLISLAILFCLCYRILQQMIDFQWKVHDRVFHNGDNGELIDNESLVNLINHFRKRQNEAAVVPI